MPTSANLQTRSRDTVVRMSAKPFRIRSRKPCVKPAAFPSRFPSSGRYRYARTTATLYASLYMGTRVPYTVHTVHTVHRRRPRRTRPKGYFLSAFKHFTLSHPGIPAAISFILSTTIVFETKTVSTSKIQSSRCCCFNNLNEMY